MENLYFEDQEILIIDDEPQQIYLVASILSEKKYKVKVLVDGTEALEVLEEKTPDLILLDIIMPNISGIELCKKIKSNPNYSSIPVIFLTAASDSETVLNAFAAGAQDYVSKPVNAKELLARVEVHLQLKRKSQKLEEAYREIESFNHMVCHDLKSPLMAIKSLVRFLNDEYMKESEEDVRLYLSSLSEKAAESITLIQKLSELSKVSSDPLTKERINMHELFREVMDTLLTENKQRNIEYSLPELPEVHGDRLLLKQVLYNVLSNAVKFTARRIIAKIDVSYSENRGDIIFCISDNGAGFNMNYSNRMFNMFQRLHTKNNFAGTGTGLAIAKKIITRHGGKIWAESEVNTGTKVFFSLPI